MRSLKRGGHRNRTGGGGSLWILKSLTKQHCDSDKWAAGCRSLYKGLNWILYCTLFVVVCHLHVFTVDKQHSEHQKMIFSFCPKVALHQIHIHNDIMWILTENCWQWQSGIMHRRTKQMGWEIHHTVRYTKLQFLGFRRNLHAFCLMMSNNR